MFLYFKVKSNTELHTLLFLRHFLWSHEISIFVKTYLSLTQTKLKTLKGLLDDISLLFHQVGVTRLVLLEHLEALVEAVQDVVVFILQLFQTLDHLSGACDDLLLG